MWECSTKVYEIKSYFLLLKFRKRSTSGRGRAGRWTVQESVAGDAHAHGAEKRLPLRVVVQVLLSEQTMMPSVLGSREVGQGGRQHAEALACGWRV
jgi:hypothetical protein